MSGGDRERADWIIETATRAPFTARDRSTIRELVGPPTGTGAGLSLAEATLAPGSETIAHQHRASEEIYHFVSGAGWMRLGDEEAEVRAGDTVTIAPGTPHKLRNPGREPLVLLCCCAPPYADADTVLLD